MEMKEAKRCSSVIDEGRAGYDVYALDTFELSEEHAHETVLFNRFVSF